MSLEPYPKVAMTSCATGPNPSIALLDLVALLTVQRKKFDAVGDEIDGIPLEKLKKIVKAGEQDAWDLAERVLSPERQAELHALIDEWYEENKDEHLAREREEMVRAREMLEDTLAEKQHQERERDKIARLTG